MDDIKYLDWIKENITPNLTMTMAHKQYTSLEKRTKYDMPIHHLSAWLNNEPYILKSFNEKENIIISPDKFRENSKLTKVEFIQY